MPKKGKNARDEKFILKRKGQYITLENMFLFAVGVIMIIAIYAVFSGMADSLRAAALQNQLEKEGESIRAGIVKAFIAGNSTNSTVSIFMDIPIKLSGCAYKISANAGSLNMDCMDLDGIRPAALNLYGIETNIKNSAIYSSAGRLIILYSGGAILLE